MCVCVGMLSTAFYCVFQIAILFSFFTHIIYALQIIGWHSPGKYLPIILKSNFNFFSPKIKYAFIIYFNNKSSKMGEKRLNFWQSEKKWYRMTVWHIFFQLSFDNAQNGLLFFEICWLYVNKMSNRPLIEIKLCTLYHWMCGLVTHTHTHIFMKYVLVHTWIDINGVKKKENKNWMLIRSISHNSHLYCYGFYLYIGVHSYLNIKRNMHIMN